MGVPAKPWKTGLLCVGWGRRRSVAACPQRSVRHSAGEWSAIMPGNPGGTRHDERDVDVDIAQFGDALARLSGRTARPAGSSG